LSCVTTLKWFSEDREMVRSDVVESLCRVLEVDPSSREILIFEHIDDDERPIVGTIQPGEFSWQRVVDEARDKRSVFLSSFVGCPRAERIEASIRATLDPKFSDRCISSSPSVTVGYYPIILDDPYHLEPELVGKSQMCVTLFGYNTPNHFEEWQEAIWEVPEVASVEKDVRAILGPVKRAVVLYV
jgi:hypothetical protein